MEQRYRVKKAEDARDYSGYWYVYEIATGTTHSRYASYGSAFNAMERLNKGERD